MKQIRENVLEAQAAFLRAFGRHPQHLFASPYWATLVKLAWAHETGKVPESIAGKQFYNMMIHVVPTLDGSFLVA